MKHVSYLLAVVIAAVSFAGFAGSAEAENAQQLAAAAQANSIRG
jgi:hypothetical protein